MTRNGNHLSFLLFEPPPPNPSKTQGILQTSTILSLFLFTHSPKYQRKDFLFSGFVYIYRTYHTRWLSKLSLQPKKNTISTSLRKVPQIHSRILK